MSHAPTATEQKYYNMRIKNFPPKGIELGPSRLATNGLILAIKEENNFFQY